MRGLRRTQCPIPLLAKSGLFRRCLGSGSGPCNKESCPSGCPPAAGHPRRMLRCPPEGVFDSDQCQLTGSFRRILPIFTLLSRPQGSLKAVLVSNCPPLGLRTDPGAFWAILGPSAMGAIVGLSFTDVGHIDRLMRALPLKKAANVQVRNNLPRNRRIACAAHFLSFHERLLRIGHFFLGRTVFQEPLQFLHHRERDFVDVRRVRADSDRDLLALGVISVGLSRK
jgi:hypothetical protein